MLISKISKPLFSALSLSTFNSIAGLCNALLIIYFFSIERQGLYYSITSITAIKVILDAGFSNVIIAYVSQNKSKILYDKEVGFREDGFKNLSNIFNYARKRYRVIALIGFIVLQFIGWYIFMDLINPISVFYWLLLSSIFAVNLTYIPYLSVIEGLDFLTSLYNFKLLSSILSYLLSWMVIVLTGDVLCILVMNAVILATSIIYVKTYKKIFSELKKGSKDVEAIKSIVSPLNTKIQISFFTGYFLNNGIVPILFKTVGSISAGRYGLAWSLFSVISTLPKQLILVVRPKLGLLYSEKRYNELWNLFIDRFIKAFIFYLALNISLLVIMNVFNMTTIANRLLDVDNMYLMSILFIVLNFKGYFSYFFRAQFKDPLYFYDILATLTIISFTFVVEEITLVRVLKIIIYSHGILTIIGLFLNVRLFKKKYQVVA